MKWFLPLAAGVALIFFSGCAPQPTAAPPNPSTVASDLEAARAASGLPAVEPGNASPPTDPAAKIRPFDPYTLEYDPDSVISLRGEILGFRRIALADDRTGLFVRVHSGGGLPWVYLGPEPWLKDRSIALKMAQPVSVTGSMITEEGQPILIAREIDTAETRLELRDAWGTPRWTLPADVALTTDQDLKVRRDDYLKRLLSYHEREAAAIRARLHPKP